MLKFTYTETGTHLERLAQLPEELVALRVLLALRVGQRVLVEPSTASFLLPANLPGVHRLEAIAYRDDAELIDVCDCDFEFVEVTLRGTWISSSSEAEEGVFIVVMSDRTEFILAKLWQEAQACTSCQRR